ncbi:hypothetical protein [Ramlibacter pallidus]|uniref:Uncharacterized protein n=1 Tax=Ramlibacter pallidus TaxID=2780087 RepID=A0ABR9S1U9_9BURK|nr:hypothetical protein [Ramlibacter pallidus]MBE7367022.1 hypothetical protein [Ramlibacter pallidus]
MTPQQAVGLAGRLFAIWLALGALQSWLAARAVQAEGLPDAHWLQYSVPAVYWLAAVLLWFFPLSIAHRLVPRTRYEDRMVLPVQQLVTVACVVLGLAVVLLRALPALADYVAAAAFWLGAGQPLAAMDADRKAGLLVGAIELAAGLACMFKADAISRHVLPAPERERESAYATLSGDTQL